MNEIKKFNVGQTYKTRFIGDADLILEGTVLSRTEKRVTIKVNGNIKVVGVKVDDGCEFVYPLGRYSMCPVLKAA